MKTFNKIKLIPLSLLFVAPLIGCNNNETEGKLVTYDVPGGVCVASLSNQDRSKITNITVPNVINGKKVVEISKGAFKSCTSLKSITLPFIGHTYDGQGIGGLFGYVFGDEMYEGGGAYTWQSYGLGDEYGDEPTDFYEFVIPSSLNKVTITGGEFIAPGAFSNCRYLREININNNEATEIGNYAFNNCIALKNFNIPNTIKTIGKQSFERCYNLSKITIPDSVTKIKHNAFSNCISASRASIPSSVNNMGKLVFNNFISGIITTTLTESQVEKRDWDNEWANSGASIIYEYNDGSMFYVDNLQLALCGSKNKYLFLVQILKGWDEKEIRIPGSVEINGQKYTLRNIGPSVFSENKTIEKVTFGEGIKVIGAHSFEKCTNLKEIVLPKDGVDEIGAEAFDGCTKLNNVKLNGTKIIGNSAFKDCFSEDEDGNKTGLKTLDFGEGVVEIGDSAFENDQILATSTSSDPEIIENKLIIPSTVVKIGERAFYNTFRYPNAEPGSADYISNIEFEENSNLEEIGEYAFAYIGVSDHTKEGFDSRHRINLIFNGLPKLKEIPNYMCYSCYIGDIRGFPQNITRIGDYAFYYSYGYSTSEEIVLNNNLEYIGDYAFYYCARYNYIFPENKNDDEPALTTIGKYAFYNCSSSKFKKANLPDTVTSLGAAAFASCSNLLTIHIPENSDLTKLEDSLFSSCVNLTKDSEFELVIPGNITKLGSSVFSSCSSIKTIEFKSTITEMGSSVFSTCSQLEDIVWVGDEVTALTKFGSSVYYRCKKLDTEDMVIPNVSSYIQSSTFYEDTQIEKFDAKGKTGFRDKCFYGCTKLSKVENTESITHIYSSAFQGCSTLEEIYIPDQVYAIGDNAFAGCTSLASLTIPASITQAWDTSTSRGMGVTPFTGWTKDQTIYFKENHIEKVDEKTGNITTVWGWTLTKKSDSNGNSYYICSASGSANVHFVQENQF